MQTKKRKAFSMIELLFVMTIMGTLMTMALPSEAALIVADRKTAMKEDHKASSIVTDKLVAMGYEVPIVNFTSNSLTGKTYSFPTDEGVFKYPLEYSGMTFRQVKTYDPETSDYTSYGIIIDSNGNLSPSCYVQNKATDAKGYWSDSCNPDSLNWDYED